LFESIEGVVWRDVPGPEVTEVVFNSIVEVSACHEHASHEGDCLTQESLVFWMEHVESYKRMNI